MWHLRLNFIVTLFSKWNRLQQRNIFSHWSKSTFMSLWISSSCHCCFQNIISVALCLSVSVCPGEYKYLLRQVTEIDSRQEQQRWGNSRGHLGGGRGRSLGWPAAAALKKSYGNTSSHLILSPNCVTEVTFLDVGLHYFLCLFVSGRARKSRRTRTERW